MTVALLCIDLINDCLSAEGKLSEGLVEFEQKNDVLQRVARIQEHVREQGGLVVHTRTCFTGENYHELDEVSPYFKKVKDLGALKLGDWGTEFVPAVAPKLDEPVINKHRFGPFSRTRLEIVLRSNNITELYIVGLSTMRSVAQCAIEAHDHDFKVVVLKDGCIDVSEDTHNLGLRFIEGVAEVKDFNEVAMRIADHTADDRHKYGV
ncbi:MAG: nicotinamidase-related amidase [Alphaproteobacteria bacterium]|jgi:nicotinamidase-related amidase